MHRFKLFRWAGLAAILVSSIAAGTVTSAAPQTFTGEAVPLGDGAANTYVTLKGDVPIAIGIRLSESALEGLPALPNNTSRCFDLNGDGTMEAGTECLGDYETALLWPREAALAGLPFKWLGLNWNAHGHLPEKVYDKPHFDVHFYMADQEVIASIRPGPCGEWVDCEDFERARIPLDPRFLPVGHADVGGVVAQMGNHLINTLSPEFATPARDFTHTLIYGAYAGELIFIEPMVTREFLLGRPDTCNPISQPAAWQKPAHYPMHYCIRYLPDEGAVTISLEGFVRRELAGAAEPDYPEVS